MALEQLGQTAERWANSPLVLVLFSALYAAVAVKFASSKLLWDDELFTLYISKAGGLSGILKVLKTGADQHPPGFYYLTDLVLRVLPLTHVTARLPAMAGFWLFCISIYYILRRLTSSLWAVAGMLLPLLTTAFFYATEARGYGLVLGFVSFSFLCWTLCTEGSSRKIWLFLLAAGVAGAVSSHYYAILACGALAAGECARSVTTKRIDWPVWAALACAVVPFAVFPSVLFAANSYSAHFWAVPVFLDFAAFNLSMLGWVQGVIVAVVVFAVWFSQHNTMWYSAPDRKPTLWWMVAVGVLILLPLITMCLALGVTHGYTDRYAISSLLGTILVIGYFFSRIGDRAVALLAIAVTLTLIFARVPYIVSLYAKSPTDLADEVAMFRRIGPAPIAITEPTIFHRFSFYAPRELATNVVYITSAESSLKYLGFDTVDRGYVDLQPWFPLHSVSRNSFLRSHPYFFTYGSLGAWNWLPYEFNTKDLVAELAARKDDVLLFLVHNSKTGLESEASGAPDGMFEKIPRTGKSLCQLYMAAGECPEFPGYN